MLLANTFLLLSITLLLAGSYYAFKRWGWTTLALLYIVASIFTLLLSFVVIDAVVAILFNTYWQDFAFMDFAFCLVLPILFFLINTFFLYDKKTLLLRRLFIIPFAVLMMLCAAYFLFFFFIVLFDASYLFNWFAFAYIAGMLTLLITSIVAAMTDAVYPDRYKIYRKRIFSLAQKYPAIVFVLAAYVLVITGHGLIRTREHIFSRAVYEQYKEQAVGMDIATLEKVSGLHFKQLEKDAKYEYWYACAQPQLWYPCRGVRAYLDPETQLITQVQARGPLVGDTFVYGFDYGNWLRRALVFEFKNLDSK